MFKETGHGVTHFTCNHRPLENGEISGCCGCDPCESCKHIQARSFADLYREAQAGRALAEAVRQWRYGEHDLVSDLWDAHDAYRKSVEGKDGV